MEAVSVAWGRSSDGGSLPMSTRSTCSAGGACDTEGWADPDGSVLALGDVHAASTRPRATRAPIDFLNHIDLFLSPYWRTGRGWSEPRYAADRSERPAIGDRIRSPRGGVVPCDLPGSVLLSSLPWPTMRWRPIMFPPRTRTQAPRRH